MTQPSAQPGTHRCTTTHIFTTPVRQYYCYCGRLLFTGKKEG